MDVIWILDFSSDCSHFDSWFRMFELSIAFRVRAHVYVRYMHNKDNGLCAIFETFTWLAVFWYIQVTVCSIG